MTYSPIPLNHFPFEMLPSDNRVMAVVTLAAACESRRSNHCRKGLEPSSRRYSSTRSSMASHMVTHSLPPGTCGVPGRSHGRGPSTAECGPGLGTRGVRCCAIRENAVLLVVVSPDGGENCALEKMTAKRLERMEM